MAKKLVQIIEVMAKYYPDEEEIAYHFGMSAEEREDRLAQVKLGAEMEYDQFDEVSVSVRIEEIEEDE